MFLCDGDVNTSNSDELFTELLLCQALFLTRVSYKLIAQVVKNLPQFRRPQFNSWVRKIRWKRDRLPTPVLLGFPCGSTGKESTWNAGDLGSIPGFGRFPEKGKYSTPVFWPRDSTDCIDHGVAESDMTEQLLISLSLVHPTLKIINILKAQSPLFYIKETKWFCKSFVLHWGPGVWTCKWEKQAGPLGGW